MAKRRNAAAAERKAKAVQSESGADVKIENALEHTEVWLERNWKIIAWVVGAILVIAGAIYGYRMLVQEPRAEKAADAMYVAEQQFIAGEYEAALNGDGNELGFVEVVDKFGGTKQGRLAAHYAGVCYVKLGDWDNALAYLAKYRASKGAPNAIVNAQNAGLQGDAWVQKGEYGDAVKFFRQAIEAADNVLTTPVYLKKLGLALEQTGDYKGAVEAYERVSDDYPSSLEARDIPKFISAAKERL